MKKLEILSITLLICIFCNSCDDQEKIDQQMPEIVMSSDDAFPEACDTLYFGETFILKAVFTDNLALGSYSIDIHHNFDHHTHSTEVTECHLADVKTPINPFTLIQDYDIADGQSIYETDLEISLPSSDGGFQYDEGDYHFHLKLVDQTGWSALYGVGVKVVYR